VKGDRNKIHKELISLWEEQNTKDLRVEQLIQLYTNAFDALINRSLPTLSSITVKVVLDRVLHEGSAEYPFFSQITLEPRGLSLKALIQKNTTIKIDELKEGLSYLLVEVLTVIGSITSDVLTDSLHKAIMQINRENALNVKEVQNLREVNDPKISLAKKRGER
jgi:hypothetical protein